MQSSKMYELQCTFVQLYLPNVVEIFREEYVDYAADEHVDDHKYDQRVELARAPEQCKQLERQQPRYYLQTEQNKKVNRQKVSDQRHLHEHVEEHDCSGEWRDSDIQQHVLTDTLVLGVVPRQAEDSKIAIQRS